MTSLIDAELAYLSAAALFPLQQTPICVAAEIAPLTSHVLTLHHITYSSIATSINYLPHWPTASSRLRIYIEEYSLSSHWVHFQIVLRSHQLYFCCYAVFKFSPGLSNVDTCHSHSCSGSLQLCSNSSCFIRNFFDLL